MLKYLIPICFLLLTGCSSSQPDAYDSQGKPIKLENYRGKWVVINYWATWCEPCITEMPALNKLYRDHVQQLIVLGVTFDNLPNAEIKKFAKQYAINYPLLSTLNADKLGIKNLTVVPMTFIVNPQGQLVKTLTGPQTEKQFTQAIGLG